MLRYKSYFEEGLAWKEVPIEVDLCKFLEAYEQDDILRSDTVQYGKNCIPHRNVDPSKTCGLAPVSSK